MLKSNTLPAKRKVGANKLVMGFTALAATAVIGATSLAAAAQPTKPTKAQCEAAGYRNHGQCVKEWAHNKNNGGGYGGGNIANVNVNANVKGDNNVITIIVRLFQ